MCARQNWLSANFHNAEQLQTKHLKPSFIFALKGSGLLTVAQLGHDLCSAREAVFSASRYEYSTRFTRQSKDIRDLALTLGKANMLM